jgi:hypothetical protein
VGYTINATTQPFGRKDEKFSKEEYSQRAKAPLRERKNQQENLFYFASTVAKSKNHFAKQLKVQEQNVFTQKKPRKS